MIRVAIVAPAMAVRAGLRALLREETNIQVIAVGTSLAEISEVYDGVDVVTWSPAAGVGLEVVRADIEKGKFGEATGLLVIHDDPQILEVLSRLTIRAWGVIDPEASQAELITSIHAIDEGLAIANPLWLKKALSGDPPAGRR